MLLGANLLVICAAVLALIGGVCLALGVSGAARARDAAFYGTRREARLMSNRRLALAFGAFVLAGACWFARGMLPDLTVENVAAFLQSQVATPQPGPAPAPTAVAAAATAAPAPATPEPTVQPTAAPAQPTPAASPTSAPSVTLTAAPEPTRAPTISPARAEQRLQLHAVASGITAAGEPRDSNTRFPSRTKTIHVFFAYHDVPPSASIRHTWFHNGGSAYFGNDMLDKIGAGVASISWTPSGGFEPGLYEVRVLLGNVPQFVANFEVR